MIMIVVMHRRFFNRITEHPCGHAVQHRLALASVGDAVVHALADVAIQELVRIGTEHLGDSVQFLHCASRINEHLLLAENRIEEVLELEVVPQFGDFFFLALGLVCFGKFRFFLLKLLVNGGFSLHQHRFRKGKIIIQRRQLFSEGEPIAGFDVILTRMLKVGLCLLPELLLGVDPPIGKERLVKFRKFHAFHGIEDECVVCGLACVLLEGFREGHIHFLGFFRAHPQ